MSDSARSVQYQCAVEFLQTQVATIGDSSGLAAASKAYLAGMWWCSYGFSQDAATREKAEEWAKAVAGEASALATSPAGGCLLAACWTGVQLTSCKETKKRLIEAGEALAGRFQQRGKYFCLDGDDGLLRIESVLSTPLVFFAANETLEQELGRRATQHTRTVRDKLVQENGSVAGSARFDSATGDVLEVATNDNPRDLALSMQGFAQCYTFANQAEFLSVSQRNAECWVGQAFDAAELDLESAATAADSLLLVAQLTNETNKADAYRTEAYRLLDCRTNAEMLQRDSACIPSAGSYHLMQALVRVMSGE